MPRDRSRDDEDDEEEENFWKGLGKDLLVAAIIVVVFLGAIYAYAGVWPPLVVVESSSMQHADRESFLGVIDTGDMVFQQAAPTRSDVVTYLEGRASGYSTYGDYGDVIFFRRAGNPTPVIHRAIMYITLHNNGTFATADVTALLDPRITDWEAKDANSTPTTSPYYLRSVTIHKMGFDRDLNFTFDFSRFLSFAPRSGYITMGDNNAYSSGYDTGWVPTQADIIGRARGEIPWFGLLKLTLQPTDSCCAEGWGDTHAPKNSWDSLLVSLLFLLALPFILEYAMRGWMKYVSPRLPEIRWPWKRRTKPAAPNEDPLEEDGDSWKDEPDQ